MLLNKNSFFRYLLKFLLTFCILYYGTIAWIGMVAPGGWYWAFADNWLDYVSWMRAALLHSSKLLLDLLGFNVHLKGIDSIKLPSERGVHVGYDCIGYGVMFFWVAFIFANKAGWMKKLQWMIGGLLAIFIVNVARVSLMVIGIQHQWLAPFDLDNHTLFNIAAYTIIFTMIYFFDRSQKIENSGSTSNILHRAS